jgi:tetratricopeptide (TPR) repeat protein
MDRRLYQKSIIASTFLLAVSSPFATFAQTEQEWRDSLSALSERIRLAPKSVDLRLRKAAVNIELGQWSYAVDEYSRVLELDPKNLSAHYYRAYVHNHERRYELAKQDYEACLAIVPRNFEAQLGLAIAKRNLGKTVEAMNELNQLIQMFPDSAIAYAARAGYEVEQKQYELALYDWDEAISRQPNNIEYLMSKADVLLMLKRQKEANALIRRIRALEQR